MLINKGMETRGSAKSFQSLSGNLSTYQVWCSSANAFTDPDAAEGVNLRITGDVRDVSQKSFEILVQAIGLRSSPVVLQDPTPVADIAASGASSLTGEGFVWCFGSERADTFSLGSDPVGLLTEELNGILLPTGVLLVTSGTGQNIEFAAKESLC